MSDSLEKIIKRVRALQEKARASEFAEEAAALNAKAAELMARHEIDEAMIRQEEGKAPDPVIRWDYVISGKGGHGKARVAAAWSVAEAYGCKGVAYRNDASSKDRTLVLIGTTHAIESLKILLPPIMAMMEADATTAARDYAKTLYSFSEPDRAKERRLYFRSYLRGWALAVAKKISVTRSDIADEVQGTGAELVLVTNADRVGAEYKRLFPKLGKARVERQHSAAGYLDGVDAGQQADIGTNRLQTSRKALS